MKKTIAIVLVMLIGIIFVGCNAIEFDGNIEVFIYKDSKTGVNYLCKNGGGITPRLNPDGSLYVTEVE